MVGKKPDKGHNWGPPNFDPLGIFYIVFAAIYSCLVVWGLYLLWARRRSMAVRLRDFPIICSTVLVLHFYTCSVILQYPLNGTYKCGEGFWIMSIVLPGGIALFQASNIRLLAYYEQQQDIAKSKGFSERSPNPASRLRKRWRRLNPAQKTYVGICIGGICQVILSTILFFGSRRFHNSYGFFGTHVPAGPCRKGLEWIPSVFWQFLWSAVFGPYVLLRIRDIKDTHYWAWQTRLAIIACLPGTPLWLVFQYTSSPTLLKVNKWFVPPMWFLPGLIMIQFVSIYFPLYDSYKTKRVCKSIASVGSLGTSAFGGSTTSVSPLEHETGNTYSRSSFEQQIEHNIEPLLHWAAQKDFTAENIVFLRSVRDYKRKWALLSARGLSATRVRERYLEAAIIYFTLVNPSTSKFNVNIDHRNYMELHGLFKKLRFDPYADDNASKLTGSTADKSGNAVTPWDDIELKPTLSPTSPTSTTKDIAQDIDLQIRPMPGISSVQSSADSATLATTATAATSADADVDIAGIHVPPEFTIDCFDKAVAIVRHDVYINTWTRYRASVVRSAPLVSSGGPEPLGSAATRFSNAASARLGRARRKPRFQLWPARWSMAAWRETGVRELGEVDGMGRAQQLV